MRIALVAPLVSPIAPPYLGGAQVLLADLARGLAQRGHEVTLYAAEGSSVPGARIETLDINAADMQPARFYREAAAHTSPATSDASDDHMPDMLRPDERKLLPSYAFLHVFRALVQHVQEYDLVHAHAFDWPAYAYSGMLPLPVIHTLHLPAVDSNIAKLLGVLAPPDGAPARVRLTTVSQACAAGWMPYCAISQVIYNGVDVAAIPFNAAPGPRPSLFFAGRISPEKGVEDALAIAEAADMPLTLAGDIYDNRYYEQHIAPRLEHLGGRVRYLGSVARSDLHRLMGESLAVLCPAHWEEPFGLVACEAQAAGTPVIAYRRGGLAEVVADGETGYLIASGDVAAAAAAVRRVGTLDRRACRGRVERLFGLETMLDAYEAFYRETMALDAAR
ncbi:MAG TPA: glycosyltransferase [Ktedonobacterales bacterium]|nr:glycosyltransferase [Ktedonobacterales bacterium]